MNFFLNKKVGILGLSKTGISSIKFLKKKGFDVFGWDDNKKILSKIKKNGLNIQILNKANLKKQKKDITSILNAVCKSTKSYNYNNAKF